MNPTTWNDEVRAALILALTNIVSVFVLLGFIQPSAEELAGISTSISSTVTLFFLILKKAPVESPVIGDWVTEMRRLHPERCWYQDDEANTVCSATLGHNDGVHG